MSNFMYKEKCESCKGNILTHHPVATCSICSKIVHAKCSQSYIYNQINNSWACTMCNSNVKQCYNPFEYFSDDRYTQDIADHTDDIQFISNLLKNCTSSDINLLSKSCNGEFNILFNNIDGNATNFDSFVAEMSGIDISIIGIAETNINSEHKELYNIDGYQSIYQSKFENKKKGSGLQLYVKEHLQFNDLEDFNLCYANIESLFINLPSEDSVGTLTVGLIYRPPNGSISSFLSEFDTTMI